MKKRPEAAKPLGDFAVSANEKYKVIQRWLIYIALKAKRVQVWTRIRCSLFEHTDSIGQDRLRKDGTASLPW